LYLLGFRTHCYILARLLARKNSVALKAINLVVNKEVWQLVREEVNVESLLRLVNELQLDPLNELGCLYDISLILAKLIY